jgi:uncharacterized coiled-coil protein SlyX
MDNLEASIEDLLMIIGEQSVQIRMLSTANTEGAREYALLSGKLAKLETKLSHLETPDSDDEESEEEEKSEEEENVGEATGLVASPVAANNTDPRNSLLQR